MRTSELIELRKHTKETLAGLISKIDSTIDKLQRSEGGESMFAGMTTKEKVDCVIDEICRYGDVSPENLRAGKRKHNSVKWAKIACYILTDHLHVSQWDIQNRLNFKNHNSVISHRDSIRGFMATNDKFNDITASTKEILNNLNLKL